MRKIEISKTATYNGRKRKRIDIEISPWDSEGSWSPFLDIPKYRAYKQKQRSTWDVFEATPNSYRYAEKYVGSANLRTVKEKVTAKLRSLAGERMLA